MWTEQSAAFDEIEYYRELFWWQRHDIDLSFLTTTTQWNNRADMTVRLLKKKDNEIKDQNNCGKPIFLNITLEL